MNGELPQRLPGAALDAIVPDAAEPAAVNLFDVPRHETVTSAIRLDRMRPMRDTSGPETMA
ncbi:hypothetical protein WDA79_04310 [Streptomyces sp. A475]|uniref:hypothetical protein n=1 Tax=Streptomyces sp. A475 TaxID=3131976 RepID=UPI0030C9D8B6